MSKAALKIEFQKKESQMTQIICSMEGVSWSNGTTGRGSAVTIILNTANLAALLKTILCLKRGELRIKMQQTNKQTNVYG